MKILLTGKTGQLGTELIRTKPAGLSLISCSREEMDITNRDQVARVIREARPDWVINTAAYTDVDGAQTDMERAMLVNRDGAGNVAEAAASAGARLLQVSTDYVFDGSKGDLYQPDDDAVPVNNYGKSKSEAEAVVLATLGDDAVVLRSSWVYSSHGHNFVRTMLRLMDETDEIRVVSDQVGSPTWARNLAQVIWQLIDRGVSGIYHWSDSGVASWYDFAVAIRDEGIRRGLVNDRAEISPVLSADYPSPASRPKYCVLDKSSTAAVLGRHGEHWSHSLREMLGEL